MHKIFEDYMGKRLRIVFHNYDTQKGYVVKFLGTYRLKQRRNAVNTTPLFPEDILQIFDDRTDKQLWPIRTHFEKWTRTKKTKKRRKIGIKHRELIDAVLKFKRTGDATEMFDIVKEFE